MRRIVAALVLLALVNQAWGGLERMGWTARLPALAWIPLQGPLMIGFLSALVAADRAVAIGRPWLAIVGALAAGAPLGALVGAPVAVWALLSIAAALGLFGMAILERSPVAALGAVSLGVGHAALFMGRAIPDAAFVWAAFVVLAFVPTDKKRWLLAIGALSMVAGGVLALFHPIGPRVFGVGLLILAVQGAFRPRGSRLETAAAAAGSVWLAIAGVLVVAFEVDLVEEAILHGLFLGYAMSIVFGRGPAIFSSILSIRIHPRSLLWIPLVILHASVLARVAGVLAWVPLRSAGGLGHAIAIGAFAVILGWSVERAPIARNPQGLRRRVEPP
jgi:hypothetical protein